MEVICLCFLKRKIIRNVLGEKKYLLFDISFNIILWFFVNSLYYYNFKVVDVFRVLLVFFFVRVLYNVVKIREIDIYFFIEKLFFFNFKSLFLLVCIFLLC